MRECKRCEIVSYSKEETECSFCGREFENYEKPAAWREVKGW